MGCHRSEVFVLLWAKLPIAKSRRQAGSRVLMQPQQGHVNSLAKLYRAALYRRTARFLWGDVASWRFLHMLNETLLPQTPGMYASRCSTAPLCETIMPHGVTFFPKQIVHQAHDG